MERHREETAGGGHRTPRGVRFVLAFLAFSSCLAFSAPAFASAPAKLKQILVLCSFRYGLPANELADANGRVIHGIRSTFDKAMGDRVAFYTERMDISAFSDERYFEIKRDDYRKRYAGRRIDLIVAVNFRALAFLIQYGEELWPNKPIVFAGVEYGRREQLANLRSNITGVVQKINLDGAIKTILKIHPDLPRITIISGISETDRFIERLIRRAFAGYADQFEIVYLNDLTLDTLLERLAELPPNSVVFYSTILADGGGNPTPLNILNLVSEASNVPVYGLFDAYVGHGVLGGYNVSSEGQGAAAAELALRIFAGEKPGDIPFSEKLANVSLFDWRQLRRWGIAEKDLPEGSTVLYRPPNFYRQYIWYIRGAAALIMIEAGLIFTLAINRSRRRRAERALREAHDRLEETMLSRTFLQDEVKHLDRVATMGTLTASMAHEIGQPLAAILNNAQAAIRFLNREPPDFNEVREALDDIVADDKRAGDVIQRLRALLKKKESEYEFLNLNDVVRDIVDLLKSEIILSKALVTMDLNPGIPAVCGDRIQIQQVVLNLLVNAFHAVKNQAEESRRIRVSTRLEAVDSILFGVSDSGPGIEEHDLETVFETFYTTKSKGMGMGLSICKSIIEQHGGRIRAANNAGKGAVVFFTLPVSEGEG